MRDILDGVLHCSLRKESDPISVLYLGSNYLSELQFNNDGITYYSLTKNRQNSLCSNFVYINNVSQLPRRINLDAIIVTSLDMLPMAQKLSRALHLPSIYVGNIISDQMPENIIPVSRVENTNNITHINYSLNKKEPNIKDIDLFVLFDGYEDHRLSGLTSKYKYMDISKDSLDDILSNIARSNISVLLCNVNPPIIPIYCMSLYSAVFSYHNGLDLNTYYQIEDVYKTKRAIKKLLSSNEFDKIDNAYDVSQQYFNLNNRTQWHKFIHDASKRGFKL